MNPGDAPSTKSQRITEALLRIIETSFPEEIRKDFRCSSKRLELDALSSLEWTEHQCAPSVGCALQMGATAATFMALAEVLGLDRRQEGHRNDVLKQLKQWAIQLLEIIRNEVPEPDLSVRDSAWLTQHPRAGVFYLMELEAGTQKLPLSVGFSPALLTLLGEPLAAPQPTRPAGQTIPMESLGLLYSLLDMELPVSILFGRAEIPLGELIHFGPGTVVELDRSTADPVEVRVNNQVVARGEVVAIEGNYGVRIKEVVSTQDRFLMTASLREQAQKEMEVVA